MSSDLALRMTALADLHRLEGNRLEADLCDEAAAALSAPAPAPLLVRDLAATLKVGPLDLCRTLEALGYGPHSVNMAVPAAAVGAVEKHYAQVAPAPAPAEAVQIEALAHRIAWRYKKSSDPNHSDTYTFNRATLLQFAAALAAPAAPAGCPDLLQKVRDALHRYHLALDFRMHGGVAAGEAINAIERALGTPWVQGAARRAAAPGAQGDAS